MSTSLQNGLVPNTRYKAPSGSFYSADANGGIAIADANLPKDLQFFIDLGFVVVGAIPVSPDAGNGLSQRANGFYAASGSSLPNVTAVGNLTSVSAALNTQSKTITNTRAGVYILFQANWSDTGAAVQTITAPSTVTDGVSTFSIVNSVLSVSDDTGATVYLPVYGSSAAGNKFQTASGNTNGHLTVRATYALTT